jgi:hypothetical protein
MPDFSVLDETELILLLEHALLSFWNDNYNIQFLSNLKMHKIMYEVSEGEDLPITRSWYMLGNNIHEREIVRVDFGINLLISPQYIALQNGRVFNVQQLIETYSEIYSEFKRCIKKVIDQTNIAKTDSWSYRRWLYREKAPKKFSLCYQASLEYLAFLSRFDNDHYLRSRFFIDDCTNSTTGLHKSILSIDDFHPFFEMLVEFTDTVEDAMLKSSLKIKNSTFNSSDLDCLQDQQQIFRDTVWKQFAKVIAIETVKGKRKDEIIAEYSNDLQDLSLVKLIIKDNKQKAKELGLFLTKTDFDQLFGSQDEIREKIIAAGNILQRG